MIRSLLKDDKEKSEDKTPFYNYPAFLIYATAYIIGRPDMDTDDETAGLMWFFRLIAFLAVLGGAVFSFYMAYMTEAHANEHWIALLWAILGYYCLVTVNMLYKDKWLN